MSQPLDVCPTCGERSLIAVCRTAVEYAIGNEGGGQSWDRRDVDDDDSTPTAFRCGSCGTEFCDFQLDADGYLVCLGTHAAVANAEGFRAWLTDRIGSSCEERGLPPGGESEDMGGVFRELEADGDFDAIGVTVLADPIEQTLYFVGPAASWVAATAFELGPEQETIWWSPLSSLRTDVAVAELLRVERSLRERADEFARVCSPRWVAHWAFTSEDNDVVLACLSYAHEPTEDEVRRDGYLWYHEEEGEVVDEAAYQAWHDRLCQPGLVSIVLLC